MTEKEEKIERSILFREFVRDIPDYRERSESYRSMMVGVFLDLVATVNRINGGRDE